MQIRIRIDVSRLFWHISFRTTPDFADVTTFYTYPEPTPGKTPARIGRAEEHPVPVVPDPCGLQVRLQVLLQLVMDGDLEPVAALLVEPQALAHAERDVILDAETHHLKLICLCHLYPVSFLSSSR